MSIYKEKLNSNIFSNPGKNLFKYQKQGEQKKFNQFYIQNLAE